MSGNEAPKIFTHRRVDLDACLSVAAVREYAPGMENAQIVFVDVDDPCESMGPNDMAVDIPAGGKGIKGFEESSSGITHSGFAEIMGRFAPKDEQRFLRSLISCVDAGDATASPYKGIVITVERKPEESGKPFRARKEAARRVVIDQGLKTIFDDLAFAVEWSPNRDQMLCTLISQIFRARLHKKRAEARAMKDAERAEWFGARDARVAFTEKGSQLLTGVLMRKKRPAAVVSVQGNILSVLVNHTAQSAFRLDEKRILRVITDAGEGFDQEVEGTQWFCHSAGFLLTYGNLRSEHPPKNPSKVDPRELARVIAEVFEEVQKQKAA